MYIRDPKEAAIELLLQRGQRDAARVLERCSITMRQLDRRPERLGEGLPLAEVLIHAPKELAACVHGSSMPEADWSNQIERAFREAAERNAYGALVIQWVGTSPAAPPAAGGTSKQNSGQSGHTPGRSAGQ
jgi:hypothetical protein